LRHLLFLSLAVAVCARADTVYLKNGNQMEGVITERTKTRITLDIGYGSTSLALSDIAKIQRSGKDQASKTAVKLKRRQYESGLAVPEGGEKLDELYRDAQSKREKALDARARSRDLDEESTQLRESLPELKANYASSSEDLGRVDAGSNPRGYNRAIGAVNTAGVRIQAAGLRLGEIDRLKQEAGVEVHDYVESHRRLSEYVRGDGAPLLKRQAEYFAWLRDELSAMADDFRQDEIPAEREGNGVFVKVLLNGKVTARLLVDTGASTTLLYQETVARLGLPPEAKVGVAHVKVADGRTVDADVLRLDSMSVGKSEVKNVLAAGSPASGQGFDGLLGMTYLGQFIFRVDAAHGRLILEDLK
jgi:clan AA aspartic protease (TIGR02281 family)